MESKRRFSTFHFPTSSFHICVACDTLLRVTRMRYHFPVSNCCCGIYQCTETILHVSPAISADVKQRQDFACSCGGDNRAVKSRIHCCSSAYHLPCLVTGVHWWICVQSLSCLYRFSRKDTCGSGSTPRNLASKLEIRLAGLWWVRNNERNWDVWYNSFCGCRFPQCIFVDDPCSISNIGNGQLHHGGMAWLPNADVHKFCLLSSTLDLLCHVCWILTINPLCTLF